MRNFCTVLVGALWIVGCVHANAASKSSSEQAKMVPANTKNTEFVLSNEGASYAIGADIGLSLKQQLPDLNVGMLKDGLMDALHSKKLRMTTEEIDQAISNLQKQFAEEQQKMMSQLTEENAKAGAEFLANNKTQKGVNSLPSGLQYKVVEAGKGGASPKADDFVTVDYEGKLINGTVFDSSYQRGQPANFQLSQVIQGWQQALQKMQVGDVWELYIPPELAYGARGLGQAGPIGPNETLVFKVHLQGIGKK
jgi:FKBP-type peptidyl-prolyl cis-trans isomerase FklB